METVFESAHVVFNVRHHPRVSPTLHSSVSLDTLMDRPLPIECFFTVLRVSKLVIRKSWFTVTECPVPLPLAIHIAKSLWGFPEVPVFTPEWWPLFCRPPGQESAFKQRVSYIRRALLRGRFNRESPTCRINFTTMWNSY